ncbi:hypothetical protein SAMN04487895_11055 [Paenibacillus sophorae]|uniref:Uncharacterized protein n=1 Tax=Paenibacillus sophorae TaxID=1333845 RepID=A0A1H8RQ55_9BACL|nr:hypothetical protein [Paenibacillus sophorae]QWU17020.1 hypothetical protein KP014_07470 [Paenibacillus sophorae]SEO68709.1 hypothetical protein SAMN04487895_11055 [Paenibacillus sophorae]
MYQQPGIFYGGGLSPLLFIGWLISIGLGIYVFVLFVKLARRGIEALDLYIYAKNREIRDRYESVNPRD